MAKLVIFSAGSFRFALTELINQYNQQGENVVTHFAPAGLLRERIEQGEACDIFISADSKNIEQLAQKKAILACQNIAKNRLVITAKNIEINKARSALELLLDPALVVGTSTPICDPSGDYTWQLFDLIEKQFPTQGERLKRTAKQLVGGRESEMIPQGQIASHYLIDQGKADIFIGYAHYAQRMNSNTAFLHKNFPKAFDIIANYEAALLSENAIAASFFAYLTQPKAKEIIQRNGFFFDEV